MWAPTPFIKPGTVSTVEFAGAELGAGRNLPASTATAVSRSGAGLMKEKERTPLLSSFNL
jgi:hypothetical protein